MTEIVIVRLGGPDFVTCRNARTGVGHCNALVPLGRVCPRCFPVLGVRRERP